MGAARDPTDNEKFTRRLSVAGKSIARTLVKPIAFTFASVL